jgi:exodeoxyribonuclease V beta subunit
MTQTPPTFDLATDLPTGPVTTVLQASAGTGKTHAIATLATRYVADGVPLDELMLVTFGRAATVELRERVRERMTHAAQALADPATALAHPDPVIRMLASSDAATRLARLQRALANFDAATISTTHGFCSQMLHGLGVAADVDPDVTFVDSATDLVTEVVTDLYVQAFGRSESEPPAFGFKVATEVAQTAVGDRSARLEPRAADAGSEPHRRRRLAEVVRDEVALRKRRGRIQDYDDLLVHLRDALADETTGEAAQERIRRRYRIVLVDEFQDTDPVQWEILERTFHGRRTLVLIGDPKQAIYAFRGADVVTYLLATEQAKEQKTLGTNWRSDGPLIEALRPVMEGVALGDARIQVGPVEAHHQQRRLCAGAPLRVRVVTRDHVAPEANKSTASVAAIRPYIAKDVARDIVSLLSSGATLTKGSMEERVQPGDIAVLIGRNPDGVTVRDALIAAGVPVVLTGTSSVFGSEAARDWLTLLSALEQPHRPGLGRTAALTSFVGWSASQLANATDEELDVHSARLRRWAELLGDRGVAALLEAVTSSAELAPRVLGRVNGERHLTDIRHIGQSLHLAATEGELGVASMVQWLRTRIAEAGKDVNEERSRRLESDAAAVQIITVHRSKGLEYPIVYAPFLWSRAIPWERGSLLLHDDAGERVRDVGGPQGPGYKQREERHEQEDADEDLRLAYVALTRAQSQVVTWWAPTWNTKTAPLHRLLMGERSPDGVLPGSVPVPTDRAAREKLDALAARAGGTISVEPADLGPERRWELPSRSSADLVARRFDRILDLTWVRTSYSGLTAGLHEAPQEVTSEAESPGTVDEPEVLVLDEAPPGDAVVSPMAGLPVGAAFGTLVHSVLEELDFTAPDLRAALVERSEAVGSERYAGVPAATLADALLPCVVTPLGPLAGDLRLADFAPKDVLAEMEYEYPLAGGDRPRDGEATVGRIGELLTRHLAADDPLRPYAADLAVPALQDKPLRGFIGGFLDAILRVRGEDGTPRYLVVDYKTNWLGGRDSLTSWDYRADALAGAMRDAHYPLQSLLYAVALHRFLRWRQPGYDPEVHLGGTLYLFLRGMCGPDTPAVDGVPAGVFSWRPPAALITELSDLLDGGVR